MAIRSALANSLSLTAESLEEIDWAVGSILWCRIIAANLDSFKVWRVFASAYPNELDCALKRKQQIISNPNMKLADYVTHIISPAFHWVTFLTLSNVTCSRIDLIQISQLTNLGVLTIGANVNAEEQGFDESIIRSWSRIATTSKAFSALRVFNCRSQKYITPRVFELLNVFPALSLFNVEDSGIGPKDKKRANSLGWKYRTGLELSDWLSKGETTGAGWDSILHASFKLARPFSISALSAEGVEAIDTLPVFHLCLGGAPPAAVVDATSNRSQQSFQLVKTGIGKPMDAAIPSKRLAGHAQPASRTALKKPMMRKSKQQDIQSLLMGFTSYQP